MLSIGTFSKISKVSTNALRYYDEIGLIRPAKVNQENGYRYYETAQLETILMIKRLKSYQLSLEEISEILNKPDENFLLTIMKEKRQASYLVMQSLKETLNKMDQDILNLERGIPIMSYLNEIEVKLIETKPQNILFVRKMMSTKETTYYFSQLFQTIQQYKLTPCGEPLTIFHHTQQEFDPKNYDNEVAIPIQETVKGTRELPGGLCAVAVLSGPYTELSGVYTKLQQWIEKENYSICGDPYEVYITDPNTTEPEKNVTEVYIPVEK